MTSDISYKTHIHVAFGPSGVMTVIADWPHVPKQSEVQLEIERGRNGYMTYTCFAHQTFRFLMPASGDGGQKSGSWGSGRRG